MRTIETSFTSPEMFIFMVVTTRGGPWPLLQIAKWAREPSVTSSDALGSVTFRIDHSLDLRVLESQRLVGAPNSVFDIIEKTIAGDLTVETRFCTGLSRCRPMFIGHQIFKVKARDLAPDFK